jgi:hypothetical protein
MSQCSSVVDSYYESRNCYRFFISYYFSPFLFSYFWALKRVKKGVLNHRNKVLANVAPMYEMFTGVAVRRSFTRPHLDHSFARSSISRTRESTAAIESSCTAQRQARHTGNERAGRGYRLNVPTRPDVDPNF